MYLIRVRKCILHLFTLPDSVYRPSSRLFLSLLMHLNDQLLDFSSVFIRQFIPFRGGSCLIYSCFFFFSV